MNIFTTQPTIKCPKTHTKPQFSQQIILNHCPKIVDSREIILNSLYQTPTTDKFFTEKIAKTNIQTSIWVQLWISKEKSLMNYRVFWKNLQHRISSFDRNKDLILWKADLMTEMKKMKNGWVWLLKFDKLWSKSFNSWKKITISWGK